MSFPQCKNCSKIQELENPRDLHTPVLGPFNYHIKGKCKCLYYQFLINVTQSISNRQVFEVLNNALNRLSKYTDMCYPKNQLLL